MNDVVHVSDVIRWVQNHIAAIGLVLGAAIGAIVWAWKQYIRVFATADQLERLRQENKTEHKEITARIEMFHAETLKTMLDLHRNDK